MIYFLFYYAFSFLFIGGVLTDIKSDPEIEQTPFHIGIITLILSPITFPIMLGTWFNQHPEK